MSTIPLPALDIRPQAPQADPSENYMRLKALLGQQQVQQQQIQAGQLENQQRQMDLDSQKALQKAYTEAQGDPDKTTKLAAQYGAKPQALLQWQNTVLEQKAKTLDLVAKQGAEAKRQADLMVGAHDQLAAADPKDRPALYPQVISSLGQQGVNVGQLPAQYPGDDALKTLGFAVKSHAQQVEDALKQAQTGEAVSKGKEAEAGAAEKTATTNFYKNNPSAGAPGVPAETVSMMDYMRRVPGATPALYKAFQAKQEAIATQPQKIAVAAAEGQARQLVEGMEKPVYAIGPDGTRTLMSATEALKGGIRTMLPVNEAQVSNDIQLNNRLGDVRQKLAQYEKAMQANLSEQDKGNIAGLLGTQGLKVGALGTEIPMDRVNALLNAENLKNLSPAGRDAIIAYRNVRESLLGYNKVLSGGSRSSDKQFELNDQTLPPPSISDRDFTNRSITAFRGNLGVVGQGLPKIPGIKSPEEIEQQASQPSPAQPEQPKDFFSQFGGKPR
jgi:hypothetical protein